MAGRGAAGRASRVGGASRFDAVVWDWNGTLLDDVDLCLTVVNEVLSGHGVPALSRERYLRIFDFPAQLYWQRAGLDLDRVEFGEVSARYCRLFEERLSQAPLQPGASGALELVRGNGLQQFLVSATEHLALSRMTAAYGVTDFFVEVRGMETGIADGKLPAARRILERYSLDPARVLLVGDTSHDAEIAQELGTSCLLVASGHQAADRLGGRGFPVVGSFAELAGEFSTLLGASEVPIVATFRNPEKK